MMNFAWLRSPSRLLPHLVAGPLALTYAWLVSQTRFVTSGLEFVAPLAVLLVSHFIWMRSSGALRPGYAQVVLGRTLGTASGLVLCVVLVALFAPTHAEAAPNFPEQVVKFLSIVACLAVLALVVMVAAIFVWGVVSGVIWALIALARWLRRPPGPGGGQANDLGVLVLVLVVIGVASLEGTSRVLTLPAFDQASSSVEIAAAPEKVWRTLGTATSPAFPLPAMLRSIPQPVAVLLDEGVGLGARRIVHFKGREGEGDLVLQVTRRTPDDVTFSALSDTSPIAHWVHQKGLSYRVAASGAGSQLTVASNYDRLLSPAWFFGPYVRFASFLAVNVLARDVKARAEAP